MSKLYVWIWTQILPLADPSSAVELSADDVPVLVKYMVEVRLVEM